MDNLCLHCKVNNMEDLNQPQAEISQVPETNPHPVSFAQNFHKEKEGGKKFIVVGLVALLLIVGASIFAYSKFRGSEEISLEPTPFEESIPESTPTLPTPIPVDKASVSINVLNGTGVAKEASYLQTQLAKIGFTKVTAGNSDKEGYTTTEVTFSPSLAQSLVDEIQTKLSEIYTKVTTGNASLGTYDVVIITGTRKGMVTPKPSPTATPKASASPASSATPTSAATL